MNEHCFELHQSHGITGECDCSTGDYLDNKNDYNENDYLTTVNPGGLKNYFRSLPLEVVTFDNPNIDINSFKSRVVKHYLGVFLSTFENILISSRVLYKLSNNFPPLIIKWLDDNSVLVEWIFKDFRIGFSIEPIQKESGWYLVSNKNLEEYSESGSIDFNNIRGIINKVLIFAVHNS